MFSAADAFSPQIGHTSDYQFGAGRENSPAETSDITTLLQWRLKTKNVKYTGWSKSSKPLPTDQ